MKSLLGCGVGAWIATLISVGAVSAHHAAAAQYNVEKVVQLTGVLTKVEWVNPHTHMSFDVKGPDGKVTAWSIEFAGVSGMRRAGLANKQALSVGQTYKLVVNPARDGRSMGLINTMTFPDGRIFRLGTIAQN